MSGLEVEGISDYASLRGTDYIPGAEILDEEEGGEGEGEDDGWEEASDEDDDSDDEWIDVHHSSDEEVQVSYTSWLVYLLNT